MNTMNRLTSSNKTIVATKMAAFALLASMLLLGIFAIFPAIPASAAAAGPGTYKVTTSAGLNVRSGPGTGYGRVGGINYGATFEVTQTSGAWGYVPAKNGWASLDYAQLVQAAPKSATTVVKKAEEAIKWAKNRLGSRNYDGWCLKFVSDAYNANGVSLGSYSTAKQCANGKTKHKNYDAPRGTLVFFDYIASDGRNLGHVGISLGDGTFIHATTGKGVIISTLRGYNDSRYLGWAYPSN